MAGFETDFSGASRRASERYDLNSPCLAFFGGFPIHATLINISLGGASFRLNFGTFDSLSGDLNSMNIEGIGVFVVEQAWSAGDRRGARFLHDRDSRRLLDDFIHARFKQQ